MNQGPPKLIHFGKEFKQHTSKLLATFHLAIKWETQLPPPNIKKPR